MEEYQQRFPFEVEKMNPAFSVSPMFLSSNFNPSKLHNKIENFESPIFNSFDLLKTGIQYQEVGGNIGLPKEDDFTLDSSEAVRSDHHTHTGIPLHPQLDISFEPASSFKPQEQAFGFPQITRSRGPSFNLGRGRLGSEDQFSGNYDLLTYMRPDEYANQQQHSLKTEYQDAYLDQEFLHNQITASPNFLPKSSGQKMPNEYSFVLQPLELQEEINVKAEESTEQAEKNTDLQSTKNKTKKKRKLNNSEESIANEKILNSPKSRQHKNENKKQAFAITPTNSLKLKITKIGEGDIKESFPSSKSKNKFVIKEFSTDLSIKRENDNEKEEKSTENSSNLSNTKIEDIGLSRAQSLPSYPVLSLKKGDGSQVNLSQYGIPSDIEEYINNSGVLSHIPFHSSRKIGTLTVEERRIKIEKYLLKRKKRTWSKKISYDCRKRVADSRLRIKGRFVTKEQAFAMLGTDAIGLDFDKISTNDIKTLLLQKFGGGNGKKKDKQDKNSSEMKRDDSFSEDSLKNDLSDTNEGL